jgi:hypothetical protein
MKICKICKIYKIYVNEFFFIDILAQFLKKEKDTCAVNISRETDIRYRMRYKKYLGSLHDIAEFPNFNYTKNLEIHMVHTDATLSPKSNNLESTCSHDSSMNVK